MNNNNEALVLHDLTAKILTLLNADDLCGLYLTNKYHKSFLDQHKQREINTICAKIRNNTSDFRDHVRELFNGIKGKRTLIRARDYIFRNFYAACRNGNVYLARAAWKAMADLRKIQSDEYSYLHNQLREPHIDLHYNDSQIIRRAIKNNDLIVLRWIVRLSDEELRKNQAVSVYANFGLHQCYKYRFSSDVAHMYQLKPVTIDSNMIEHVFSRNYIPILDYIFELVNKNPSNADMAEWFYRYFIGKQRIEEYPQILHKIYECARPHPQSFSPYPYITDKLIMNTEIFETLLDITREYPGTQDQHNKTFIKICHSNFVELGAKFIDVHAKLNIQIDILSMIQHTLSHSYYGKNIQIFEWLIKLSESYGKIDIHFNNEEIFRTSCYSREHEVLQYLIKLGETSYGKINIHANNEEAFRNLCQYGSIDGIKWLIKLGEESYGKINIHANNEEAFTYLCKRNCLEGAKWLFQLGMNESYGLIDIHKCADRYVRYEADIVTSWSVRTDQMRIQKENFYPTFFWFCSLLTKSQVEGYLGSSFSVEKKEWLLSYIK